MGHGIVSHLQLAVLSCGAMLTLIALMLRVLCFVVDAGSKRSTRHHHQHESVCHLALRLLPERARYACDAYVV